MISPSRVLRAIEISYFESYPKELYCFESTEPEAEPDAENTVVIESGLDCCRMLAPSSQLKLTDGLLLSNISSLQLIL